MIKNPFNPKNIFWYKIFKPFVDMLNKMQDSSDNSGIDVETDKTTIKKGNAIIELTDGFIRVGILVAPDETETTFSLEINETVGGIAIVTRDTNFVFDTDSIDKLQDIMSKYDKIMAL